jgi:hypothetical protein
MKAGGQYGARGFSAHLMQRQAVAGGHCRNGEPASSLAQVHAPGMDLCRKTIDMCSLIIRAYSETADNSRKMAMAKERHDGL